MEGIMGTIFWILSGMVVVWFGFVKILFVRLEKNHPEKFKEMGEPSLIWNNSLKNNLSFMKFLFKREHRVLEDPTISRLSDLMLLLFAAYFVSFIFLVWNTIMMVPLSSSP